VRLARPSLGLGLGVLLAIATLLLPQVLSDSQLTIYVFIGLATIVVAGLSLLMGFAGQVSLGQAAFYAIGAYASGLLAKRGLPPVLALVAAPIAAGGVGALMGVPLLRLRGHYLAFATLAFQLIVLSIIGEAKQVTGGDIGLSGIPALGIGPVALDSPIQYAYLTWAAAAGVLLISRNLVDSRPGRGLRALATSEIAAAASGVPVGSYKLRIFALSASYAGLAGGIYGFFLSYISPGSFPVLLSIQFLVMAAIGGLGAVWGSLFGAALITLVVQYLKDLGAQPGMPTHAPAVLTYAVYAGLLIVVMLFLPDGLLPALMARAAGWRRRLQPAPADA